MDLSLLPAGATALTTASEEPTLVEWLDYVCEESETLESLIVGGVRFESEDPVMILSHVVPAGSGIGHTAGRIAVDRALAPGWRLVVWHSFKHISSADRNADFVAWGGIIR